MALYERKRPLKSTVGSSYDVEPDDVFNLKEDLIKTGHMKGPPDPIPSTDLFDGMKKFQADNGLSPDGIAKPGGPTERKLAQAVSNGDSAETQWKDKPDKNHFSGETWIDTDGPVRVDHVNPSMGVDGIDYTIEWHQRDRNGNVVPNIRNDRSLPRKGGHIAPMTTKSRPYHPPFKSDTGYKVRVWIPPQPSYSGNSNNPYLNIYTPSKGNNGSQRK